MAHPAQPVPQRLALGGEVGGGNIGRNATLWTIGIFTAGIGLLFLPFFKKCQYCGHNMWWNKHYGPDLLQAAFATTNQTA